MAEWTNLHEIMQDLSVAQGCLVPASIKAVTNSGPPILYTQEENEEQSYCKCEGGRGDIKAPDYDLIRQMLKMVKETEDGTENNGSLLTSDLKPLCPELVPQAKQRKYKKNVALATIIAANEAELASRCSLSKDCSSMFKWKRLKAAEDSGSSSEKQEYTLSPDKYVKCLEINHLKDQFAEDAWFRAKQMKLIETRKKPQTIGRFIPSARANEYYKQYLEKSRLKEQFEEDIWSRAERRMKDIEAKKKREAEVDHPQALVVDVTVRHTECRMNFSLPQERHLMAEKCVVCEVANKHGYNFKTAP